MEQRKVILEKMKLTRRESRVEVERKPFKLFIFIFISCLLYILHLPLYIPPQPLQLKVHVP